MAEGFYRDFLGAWADFRIEGDEYRELDNERVLVLAHYSGRGKTSGLDMAHIQLRAVGLFHVRDGKVTRHVVYLDFDHALADLGLKPDTGT